MRTSGTLDLHRTPLILAMSVGLYARKAFYEIPSSIAELYRAMIDEMLDRPVQATPGRCCARSPTAHFCVSSLRSPAKH